MSDAIKEAQEILQKMTEEILMNHPVWMKCNYLLSQLGNIPEEKWKDIKWDYINKVLKETNLEIDFNIFDEVHSMEEFMDVRTRAVMASIPEFNEPYLQRTCKTCNEDFTLTLREVNYFQDKKLELPKRCHCCRKGIVKSKKVEIKPVVVEEEPTKTAMQLALEKANIA